ncbi:hypothetical protein BCR44DRAFT_47333 [Catenaria anguillulae PL171]|uniref:Uncharacterized protein n=1 Tax=Catenaria anguillulae PL171 TaxID=765915 RepID=A0A1Y2HNA6_9FUNG|nr:hypothetical protein BCR44DRAFT_47333 [Catenaria anguillulae PL171]
MSKTTTFVPTVDTRTASGALLASALLLWVAHGLAFANINWIITSITPFGARMGIVAFGLLTALMAVACIETVRHANEKHQDPQSLLHGYLGVFTITALPLPLVALGTSLVTFASKWVVFGVVATDVLFILLAASVGTKAAAAAAQRRREVNAGVNISGVSADVELKRMDSATAV